ncbi:hypothetical protein AVEN_249371-1 [Araneus ventricosus]|uniref:Peptidase aspartic putative domain-containing protein n=1 Tax=Araneus ventricosus TaxID=182803 RepID=A0A4Y2LGV3_ARAVE|nr:hypothetical protein AVEN_249371-1 [Araneus ventricosus]
MCVINFRLSSKNDVNLSNINTNPKVFLQTFKVKLLSGGKEKTIHVLCDTGSQKSNILKNIAEEMKYPISRQETIKYSLFGGVSTKEFSLPWADDSFPLPDKFNLAKKGLEVTTEKLLSRNLYDKYEKVFQEWFDEAIIEEVPPNEAVLYGNYLPHRPVIKESSSTTPIRRVFDASASFKASLFKPVFTVWINVTEENLKHCTIHTFCDASKEAYAVVVFLILEECSIKLPLLVAKSRIAPLSGGTIPCMELLAALVGARLTNSVIEALNWKKVKCYYWSDFTTVLAWISRVENWSIFVRNGVQEISSFSMESCSS